MAQILLLELIGRGPDKPDNVVVVGDDDQSIYRFRGASYAAFEEFTRALPAGSGLGSRARGCPAVPAHAAAREPALDRRHPFRREPADRAQPGASRRARSMPIKDAGVPVEIVHAADEHDEADVVVSWIKDTFAVTARAAALERHRGAVPQAPPSRADRRSAAQAGHSVCRHRWHRPVRRAGGARRGGGTARRREPGRLERASSASCRQVRGASTRPRSCASPTRRRGTAAPSMKRLRTSCARDDVGGSASLVRAADHAVARAGGQPSGTRC